jgi:hypothetical protein
VDKYVALDDFLRFVGAVLAIIAAAMILFISVMATDSSTQQAYQAVVCAFVPRYEPPIEGRRLFQYLLLRLPTYAIAVGGPVFLLFVAVLR